MISRNRQWLLRSRPQGLLRMGDVELASGDLDVRALRQGEIRVGNLLFLYSPTMRNWMAGHSNSRYPSRSLGATVQAIAASGVIESMGLRYPVGSGQSWNPARRNP